MRGSHIALVIQVSVTTWDHLICFLVHVIHHMQLCLWHLEQQLVHGGGDRLFPGARDTWANNLTAPATFQELAVWAANK